MKKFIFWLIFLIIIAGVAGYFGWIRVPENNVALGFSTITGYDTEFMESGKINWRWQKLIPKCYVLKYYQLETENAEVSVEQSLPSGDLYSGAMAGKPDFSFAVKYAVTYKIKEDSLYAMATSGTLGDGGLSQFYAAVKEKIQNTAASLLGEEMSKALNGSTFSQKTLEDAVKARIGDQIADVEIISFETAQARFPDVELYKAAKAKYMENLEKKQELEEKQQEISAQQEKEKEDMNSKIEQRIELLKKYGELLTQYPILIEYFKSKNESLLPEDIKIEDIIK
ncbi:MAG: hypothetical protein IJQ86_08035 [Spirochaetia bacterium]|nr:hypothetical protein [Spirochaetia bacterium]